MAKVGGFAGIASWAREKSPWKNCAACDRCAWWTGWMCRNEPTGFRDCKHYGTAFAQIKILCRDGRHVPVKRKKGETDEQLAARAFSGEPAPSGATTAKPVTRPANSVNLFEL